VRKLLRQHVDERAFKWRLGSKARDSMLGAGTASKQCAFAFDAGMLLHPLHADLAYIKPLASAVQAGRNVSGEC
jgi:hypothetical protein